MPATPAPGPLDVAFSLILHRALPFSPRGRHGAIRARLGWGPQPPVGQREAGALIGLSHQRLAQLEHRVLDMLAATGPPPSLLLALQLLADRAPCESAMAALALYAEGITGEVIHPAGVLATAAAAGAASPVEMAALEEGRTAVVPAGSGARRAVLVALARRRVTEVGVARLGRLLPRVGPLSELEIDAALRSDERVGRTGDVLWGREDRGSMLVRPLERMLAALGSLPVEKLVDGVARRWRYRRPDDVPDAQALTAYLAGQGAYLREEDGRWSLAAPAAAEELLLPEDKAVIELIRDSPAGQVPRREIAAALVAAGYSPNSLTLLIGTSPVLLRVGHAWYTRLG